MKSLSPECILARNQLLKVLQLSFALMHISFKTRHINKEIEDLKTHFKSPKPRQSSRTCCARRRGRGRGTWSGVAVRGRRGSRSRGCRGCAGSAPSSRSLPPPRRPPRPRPAFFRVVIPKGTLLDLSGRSSQVLAIFL